MLMGTKYAGSPDEVRALNSYIKLTRAAESVLERTNRQLGRYHLTTSQFGVLDALYHLGTLSQVDLARKILKSSGNITTVLQNLERAGLIHRERDMSDQRFVRVTITDSGRALMARILPDHIAGIVADLSVLTPDEQDTLAALCRKLGQRVTS